MGFDWVFLLIAFGGGIAGAAFGALPIFILLGLMVFLGAGLTLISPDLGNQFSSLVTWGPLFGPQISFASGCAAAAYAASRGKLSSGRDIVSGLAGLGAPDVLLIGGLFGSLGYVFQWLLGLIQIGPDKLPITNPIAASICVSAIVIRLLWSKKGIFGEVRPGDNRWAPSDVAAWIPWQARPLQLVVIAVGVSLPTALITSKFSALATLIFGVLVFALIFIQYGTKIPIAHHVALAAGQFVVAAGGDIGWGIVGGLIGAFAGEIGTALLMNHADTHFDPPSIALTVSMTCQTIFLLTGLMKAFQGPTSLIFAVVVGGVLYAVWALLQRRPHGAVSTSGTAQPAA